MILINAASRRPGDAPLRRLSPGSGTVVVPCRAAKGKGKGKKNA